MMTRLSDLHDTKVPGRCRKEDNYVHVKVGWRYYFITISDIMPPHKFIASCNTCHDIVG